MSGPYAEQDRAPRRRALPHHATDHICSPDCHWWVPTRGVDDEAHAASAEAAAADGPVADFDRAYPHVAALLDETAGPVLGEEAREHHGRIVREAWVRWARTQPNPKPSWLVPWEDLPEPDREADRCIADALVAAAEERGAAAERERIAQAIEADQGSHYVRTTAVSVQYDDEGEMTGEVIRRPGWALGYPRSRALRPHSSGAVVTDPAVQAVAEALREWDVRREWQAPTELAGEAQVAVDAYRRAVLASRPDAERWASVRRFAEENRRANWDDVLAVLAALADETAARQQTEADRERIIEEIRTLAGTYPAEVFPPDSESRDAVAGTALRTVLGRLVERLDCAPRARKETS